MIRYRLFRWALPRFCALFGAHATSVAVYPLRDHVDVSMPLTERHRVNAESFKRYRAQPWSPTKQWKAPR